MEQSKEYYAFISNKREDKKETMLSKGINKPSKSKMNLYFSVSCSIVLRYLFDISPFFYRRTDEELSNND